MSYHCCFKSSEKCLGERRTALNRAKTRKGVFIPECNPDGTFKSVQCHKDTGYCWCSSPLGHAVIGTDTHNDVPDCQNLTNKPPDGASTLRPPIWSKGIAPGEGVFIIKTDIDSTLNSARSNRESTDLTIEGEVDPESSGEDKKKQPKRPRGSFLSRSFVGLEEFL
ncbi:SPARC-related modular calcium-binding protein 1 [Armadillidium vulgare]|nr:SPARC-related modular calcium-binding protein 1 [Armadillidium vulgare]